MTDYISLVNQWCQQNKKPFPTYEYKPFVDDNGNQEWMCDVYADWLPCTLHVRGETTKKAVKQVAAALICQTYLPKEESLALKANACCIMIDGDQRADCWKWLASQNIIVQGCTIKVYTGPTTPYIESTKPIEHIRATSPSRDAADAKILMDLGAFIALNKYNSYIIVSSDHILVQAALDTANVDCAANLASLKQLFV